MAFLAVAEGPKPRFSQPDGRWWLTASQPQRDGFLVGYWSCADFLLHQKGPDSISDQQVEGHISEYYRSAGSDLRLPVTAVISHLFEEWQRTGAYRFSYADPTNEYDGDYWRQGLEGERPALIRGFLSCQAAAGNSPATASPVESLVRWISNWYGINPNDESAANEATVNQALSKVILRAEREVH